VLCFELTVQKITIVGSPISSTGFASVTLSSFVSLAAFAFPLFARADHLISVAAFLFAFRAEAGAAETAVPEARARENVHRVRHTLY
jgi:hypothetical protein